MKIVSVRQGTPEWAAHRALHWNASDAPAMMGVSPYKTRAALLRERATGITAEVDAATQGRFDAGHRAEELARPLAEKIIGEDLYPCTGVADDGTLLSASFDGLTLGEDTAFEHKSLNDDLRRVLVDDCAGASLPIHYRVQMEQQCLVSGAEQVLFMASKWAGDGSLVEERHCWYRPDPDLRAKILAGWMQFAIDVEQYQPEAKAAPVSIGRAPDQLPALHIEVTGMVTASNLQEFKDHALAVLGSINRDLQTDEDFANAEQTVKWAKGVEERLEGAKIHALSQTASIDELFRTIDSISAETRRVRLELDKLVTREKDSRKAEIVQAAIEQVRQHYATINATMAEHALQMPATVPALIGAAIKGKRTIATIRDAADAAAAQAKIDGSQVAERTRGCMAVLDDFAEHAHLFADRVQLCAVKAPEDLRNLAQTRVAEHQQREADRLERERARIRQEEADKLAEQQAREAARVEAEQRAQAARAEAAERPKQADADQQAQQERDAAKAAAAQASPQVEAQKRQQSAEAVADMVRESAKAPATQINLGEINEAIAPLSINAAGLAGLGFMPAATKGAAKLYAGEDFPGICEALARLIAEAPARAAQKKEA